MLSKANPEPTTRTVRRIKIPWTPILFLLPYLVVFLLFRFGPTVAGVLVSFTNWKVIGTPEWAGMGNYRALFGDPLFLVALKNTVAFLLMAAPATVVLGLMLALLLNKKLFGRAIARTVIFAPYAVMFTVAGIIWNWMYDSNFGLINQTLESWGLGKVPWLTSEQFALMAIAIVMVWWLTGYAMVLFLAGLQDIPEELYEAASIDGASSLQKFRWVTLPLLAPTTFIVVMLVVINVFQIFDLVYVMTNGGPGTSTLTLVHYMYVSAFSQLKLGYGSAIAVVVFVILTALAFVQTRFLRQEVNA
ncbi:multiple sugar transport system permease protein [Deinobacterium chartae]|uniref:Multiple sugar transport system permease protein n=1 Tax=Deinobacterium chartae TaxID=521158 RepID=A0A841HXX5_9DEIO|nr:sugar ABC transporter permease [Deinobacterium chartae]MBB6096778.1 multiple sugar transport system permease protein [Deinobacterium chartae]